MKINRIKSTVSLMLFLCVSPMTASSEATKAQPGNGVDIEAMERGLSQETNFHGIPAAAKIKDKIAKKDVACCLCCTSLAIFVGVGLVNNPKDFYEKMKSL